MNSPSTEAYRLALIQANPTLSRFNSLPRILLQDEFDDGACGWTELIGNYGGSLDRSGSVYGYLEFDMRPPMLSSLSMWDTGTAGSLRGTYALKLATRPQAGRIAQTVKRITWSRRALLQLETYFAYKVEAVDLELSRETEAFYDRLVERPDADTKRSLGEAAYGAFGFAYDLQDDEERYWPSVRYLNAENGELVQQWQYHAGGVRHPHLDGRLEVPGGRQQLCYNEIPTKQNWHYLRWLIDLDSREYVELQCNDRIFDLRGRRHEYRNIHPREAAYTPYMDRKRPGHAQPLEHAQPGHLGRGGRRPALLPLLRLDRPLHDLVAGRESTRLSGRIANG